MQDTRLPALSTNLVRRFDLLSLQLFVSVAEERNLTRTAAREAIAPSALSRRLAELEAALDVQLFVRGSKGMSLTPAGESLLHHARTILLKLQSITVELNEHSHGVRGHVRMLANLSSIVQFLPEDLPGFFGDNRLIRIELHESSSEQVVRGVEQGRADIGICSNDVDTHGLERFVYRKDRLIVVVPRDHPLAVRDILTFADTLDFEHIGLYSASSIYLRSQHAANQAGKALKLRIHVPGFDAVCRMVEAGMGIGLMPDRAFEVLSRGMQLRAVPVSDAWAHRALLVLVRRADALPAAARLLLQHLVPDQVQFPEPLRSAR